MTDTKKCTKCGEIKGRGEFHKNNKKKDRLHLWCKRCVSGLSKKRKNQMVYVFVSEKKCITCGGVKPRERYYKSNNSRDGLRGSCKSCMSNYNKNRISNMEYDYVSEKKCTVCAITKPREEYHRSRNRNDGLFGACKECVYEYTNKWRQDNKGYYSIRAKLRKQQMDRAMPHWLTNEQHQQIQAIYDHARECSSLTGDAYVVDHIVPIKGKNVCGLHVPWNLQVLPSDVNDSKGNRMPPKDQHVAPVCELRR